jgi:arylformamidase
MPSANAFQIIDISQPVSSKTACFPGDIPFSQTVSLTCETSNVCNLTAITMSPHVGTHIDAAAHVVGTLGDTEHLAGTLPLDPFVGPVGVVDISPMNEGGITTDMLRPALQRLENKRLALEVSLNRPVSACTRLLIKTQPVSQPEIFKDDYPYPDVEAIEYLASRGINLVGVDTPSVDHVKAKDLRSHKALIGRKMHWLENLDLSSVAEDIYFLVAAPLKLMETEAAPVRAILLQGSQFV